MNPERRGTFQFKYKNVDLTSLQKLSAKITPIKLNSFVQNYGRILDILNEKMDMMTAVTIAQFYDPPLRCFTFSDFQLAPTLEEVERIVGRNLKDHNPFPKLDEDIPPERIASALGLKVSAYDPLNFLQGRSQLEVRKCETTERWIIELSDSHCGHHVHLLI